MSDQRNKSLEAQITSTKAAMTAHTAGTPMKFAGYEAPEGDWAAQELVADWKCQLEWARAALKREDCKFDNGTTLHGNAALVESDALDALLPYMTFTVDFDAIARVKAVPHV